MSAGDRGPVPDALRALALARLAPPADARAADLVARARLAVEPDVARWEGSAGRVRAHRVLLGVDAASLARLARAPAVRDAVTGALAAAVAARAGWALADVVPFWAAPAESPARSYRDAPAPAPLTAADPDPRDDPAAVLAALEAYLAAAGHAALGAHLADARCAVARTPQSVRATLTLPRARLAALRADPAAGARLAAAARALLRGPEGSSVRLALHAD